MHTKAVRMIFLVPIVLIGAFLLTHSVSKKDSSYEVSAQTSQNNGATRLAKIALWKDRIAQQGGATAYKNLLSEESEQSPDDQHYAGHIFGRALYEELGLAGYNVCDDSLFGGCQHEFFSAAIEEHGLEVIPDLNKNCLSLFADLRAVTCQHGIGHGLLYHFGYNDNGINKSLEQCSKFSSKDRTKGCYGGVFMEYNLQVISDLGARAFSATTTYTPCTHVAVPYQNTCYFWLPQWWREASYKNDRSANTYTGLGKLCDALDPQFIGPCFQGIGYTLSATWMEDSAQAEYLCKVTSKSKVDQYDCWSVANGTVQILDL